MISFKNFFLSSLALLVGGSLALSSCSSEPGLKPKVPTDETINKNHDMPTKVVLTLFRGHFHGRDFHANVGFVQQPKYYDSNEQVITLVSTPEGFRPEKGSRDKFVVQGGFDPYEKKEPKDPSAVDWTDATFNPEAVKAGLWQYGLTIRLFAANGDEITGQFASPEESKIHQLFFIPQNIKATKFRDPKKPQIADSWKYFYYYYMDTDPWDTSLYAVGKEMDEKGASKEEKNKALNKAFKGISNPIGLKGFMEFYESETSFTLNIKMLHAVVSKFVTQDGKTSPFCLPSQKQKMVDNWDDLNIKVPIVVFAYSEDYLEETDFSTLTETDKLLVRKLADAYGITEKEAFDDLLIMAEGEKKNHSMDAGHHL